MPLILGAPTGDIYDARGISHDSLGALILDRQIVNQSLDAGARVIPSGTYRLGTQLRRPEPAMLDDFLRELFQTILREKHKILRALQDVHKDVHPVINLHGSGTSPYKGPHGTVNSTQQYHRQMIEECLSPIFPARDIPLLYELIPTVEEACIIAEVCKNNGWKVVISLFTKKDSGGVLCLQTKQGKLIPLIDAIGDIEQVADPAITWYSFNCFDPRLVPDIISALKKSHLWHRVRGMYPNLADAEKDSTFTSLWNGETEECLISWDPPSETMPAFIGACCGSDHTHIQKLAYLLSRS